MNTNMASTVWGLDMRELQWDKFKSSYMWNNVYHLRRTKFIVYQIAMLCCIISQSLTTAVLEDLVGAQKQVKHLDPHVVLHNSDYVGISSGYIPVGMFVSTVLGAAFFLDLVWPTRVESKAVRTAWKVCGIIAVLLHLGAMLAFTVITARNCGHFTFTDQADASKATLEYGQSLLSQYHKNGGVPLCYRRDGRAIAALAFGWPGTVTIMGSCILIFMSINHAERTLLADPYGAGDIEEASIDQQMKPQAELTAEVSPKADLHAEAPPKASS